MGGEAIGPYQLYMNTSPMPETDNFRESPAMTGELVVTSGLIEALHLSSFFVQDHRTFCKISMVKSCMNIWGIIVAGCDGGIVGGRLL
jgi:hypothetical protein